MVNLFYLAFFFMSEIIAITNTKGGVSKTTTAVHLARWLQNEGNSVIFVNASFQRGVHDWLKDLEIPFHQENHPDELMTLLESLENKADYILIDVPGSSSEIVRVVLDCCGRALVPVKPSMLDLEDCISLINIVKRKQRIRKDLQVSYFISRIDGRSNAYREAIEYFQQHGIELLTPRIRELKIIQDTPAYSCTVFDLDDKKAQEAAKDYHQLFTDFLNYA